MEARNGVKKLHLALVVAGGVGESVDGILVRDDGRP